jgi:hypothetical protein
MSTDDREVVLRHRSPESQIEFLLRQVALLTALTNSLERRLSKMETQRKGGRPSKPIIVKTEGICGVEPAIDSATCPYASLYRRRQGCQGDACMKASSDYYKEHK